MSAIRIWQSYSCNNSSSYRMVARFADAATAAAIVPELEEFFKAHANEIDARGQYSDDPTAVSRAVADKYGFDWDDLLYWGTGPLIDDTPELFVEGRFLIVQHTYCGGGFGVGFPDYLRARGAEVDHETETDITMSLLFRSTPGQNDKLDVELAAMFAQLEHNDGDDYSVYPLRAPWKMSDEAHGQFSYFRDAGTVGLHFPTSPRDIDEIKRWLTDHGIDKPVIRIAERDDLIDFVAIRDAKCTACSGPLEYLDPALHDIETRQLVCRPCGGFYELSTFVPPPSKR